MIVPNQRGNSNIIDFYIDGNLFEDDLYAAVDEYYKIDDVYSVESRWWDRDSFHFIYGHSLQSHLYISDEGLPTSGFSTSWATPVATSMVLHFMSRHHLRNSSQIRSRVHGKVFDPFYHKQFLRRFL
jgi:hypothetical protein